MRMYYTRYNEVQGCPRYEVGYWPEPWRDFLVIGIAYNPTTAEALRQELERVEAQGVLEHHG